MTALGASPCGFELSSLDNLRNTRDAIRGSFGPDVKFLNRALELVFEMLGNAGD
jgi:hypothetical protein